jgi:hypothetical protein
MDNDTNGTGHGVITGYGSVKGIGYGSDSLNNFGMGRACGSGNFYEKFCGQGNGEYFGSGTVGYEDSGLNGHG